MLLQALYQYAQERNLLADLPFQRRTVHLLIPLNGDGSLRGVGFDLLTTPVVLNDETKEKSGQEFLLPRFPGEKNNTKAQYLADPVHVVLGVKKETLEPYSEDAEKVPDAVHQFRMFWRWVEEADARLKPRHLQPDPRLQALLTFRRKYLAAAQKWLIMWTNPRSRNAKPEPAVVLSGNGEPFPLAKGNTVGFSIGGQILAVGDRADPLWVDWSDEYKRAFYEEIGDSHLGIDQPSLCLLTGESGQRIAAMHKPEIKIPGGPPKGASFFSCGADAFCSYGFKGGENATISVDAVASYALALEHLLGSEDSCIRFLTGRFCFWTEKKAKEVGNKFSLLGVGSAKVVSDFLKEPFSGIEDSLAKSEQFMSVTLSANGGRVVVRDWLRVRLESAIENLANWFRHLAIVPPSLESRGRPYRIHNFVAQALKRPVGKPSSQYKQRFDQLINEFYRHAINGTPPPVHLLEPILATFRSDLVTDSDKKPKYPFSQSRFALIKLILTRNPNGGFMPKAHLAETDDPAYNLGRLLMVFSKLQKAAHKTAEGGLKGPGIVERYYAEASSAPATAFPMLYKLHQQHLRKLEQQGEKGRKYAEAFRNKIDEILAVFKHSTRQDGSPDFPRQLPLEAQGRFALGFYQQRTHDRIEGLIRKSIRDAKDKRGSDQAAATELLNEANRIAEKYGYPDLINLVRRALSH
jgi:CRISPR-associated protein Csd1